MNSFRALAARLQTVREEERIRVAREIHDVLAQELTSLKIDVALLTRLLARSADESPPSLILEKLAEMAAVTDTAIQSVQKIATDLRPAVLDSLGLCAAIEWQAGDFQSRTGIACAVRLPAQDPPLDRERSTALFRILQESLTNVARHAAATRVEIQLQCEAGQITLTVRDNGRGIPPSQAAAPSSVGLMGMRERALLLGGRFDVAGQPDEGTTVAARIPLVGAGPCRRPAVMKILIADDHVILRRGLKQILALEFPGAKFGEAGTCQETIDRLGGERWDVLVLDIFMPGRSGLDVLLEIGAGKPELPVLVLSSAPEEQMAPRVLAAGATGYLNKQTAPEELARAVKQVAAGGIYVSAKLAERLDADLVQPSNLPRRRLHERLSDREFQVMQMLVAGKFVKEIAAELNLSPKTVSTFHSRILQKLRLQNDVELVRYAIEHQLIESPPRELG